MDKFIVIAILIELILIINGIRFGIGYTIDVLQAFTNNEHELPTQVWLWIQMTIIIVISAVVGYIYRFFDE